MVQRVAEEDPEREPEEPDDPEEFGFHFPEDYLDQVIDILLASNFCYWPEAGGLNDQDAHLVEDVRTWLKLHRRIEFEYKAGQWRGPDDEPPQDAPPKFNPLDRSSH